MIEGSPSVPDGGFSYSPSCDGAHLGELASHCSFVFTKTDNRKPSQVKTNTVAYLLALVEICPKPLP